MPIRIVKNQFTRETEHESKIQGLLEATKYHWAPLCAVHWEKTDLYYFDRPEFACLNENGEIKLVGNQKEYKFSFH